MSRNFSQTSKVTFFYLGLALLYDGNVLDCKRKIKCLNFCCNFVKFTFFTYTRGYPKLSRNVVILKRVFILLCKIPSNYYLLVAIHLSNLVCHCSKHFLNSYIRPTGKFWAFLEFTYCTLRVKTLLGNTKRR